MIKKSIYTFALALLPLLMSAQGFLHADGTAIVNGNGDNVLLRGIGTGNWMVMEGYMMKTTGELGTQHAIRSQLEKEIGVTNTDIFFDTWLANHMTRADVDSMKAWGFNSVRAAMHYNVFTPAIQDEPVAGEITWLDKGFEMVDSLLDWCADNEMHLILDMHATPGGQGKNADISDYNDALPSLWESEENQTKLTALWYELAKRYKDETWIGGYDLINETNWDFENSGNENGVNNTKNIPLLEMHMRIIDTIRTIDENHLVFVSGNSWGNNYNGMDALASHDDNLAYTFHKYWNTNNDNDVEWITKERDRLNVPLWMSESGENSNTWYADAIALFETNNIGWSWWPVKKEGINNVMYVDMPSSYDTLVKVWKNELNVTLTADQVFDAVMDWAENHKIENCKVKYDVIDAMIRQPHSKETLPFKTHKLTEPIFFSDFDYGNDNYAYHDTYVANYGGAWTGWNNGWALRNDGVDIEEISSDLPAGTLTNGYNIGFTDADEWMQYTLKADSTAAYTLEVSSASGASGCKFHLEVNGVKVTDVLSLPGTGDWQNWQTTTFDDVIIPGGDIKIKFYLDNGGSNLNYFLLKDPKSIDEVEYKFMSAQTTPEGDSILIDLNKEITSATADLSLADFNLKVDGETVELNSISISPLSNYVIILTHNESLYSDQEITISYNGSSVKNGTQELTTFSDQSVTNNLQTVHHVVPGRIQAEEYVYNSGFSVVGCEDTGGGQKLGYTKPGYYTTYLVHVENSGEYQVYYRVATERSGTVLSFEVEDGDSFTSLTETSIVSTGGWSTWQTQQSDVIYLEEGYYTIKVYVKSGEFDLNWFEIDAPSANETTEGFNEKFSLYPNPAKDYTMLKVKDEQNQNINITVYSISGKKVAQMQGDEKEFYIHTGDLAKGMYFISVNSNSANYSQKLIIQ